MELTGKRILVTGAAKGIGVGLAEVLAAQGAELMLHYRSSPEDAAALQKRLEANGATVHLCRGDLGKTADLERLFETIDALWGGLDGAVNNAGWDPGFTPVETIDYDKYDQLTSINIRGTLFCTLHEMALMRRQPAGGSIVNIGSVHQDTSVLGRTLYAMSKGAIHSLSAQLALEGGRDHIRVNCIAPGYIAVPRLTAQPGFNEAEIADGIPIGRLGRPQDIGELASFLLSDRAEFITGQTLIADGGVDRKLARSAKI